MLRPFLAAAALCFGLSAAAADATDELIRPIQQRWAEIKYRLPPREQAERYRELAEQAHRVSAANPNHAPALIWEGIVISSEAGARGGLGALSLAKEARRLLEESLKLDEGALDGSAYTSLATLYARVPHWPLGFGDRERAEELFRKALALNPGGIDPNFFYGEYLLDQGKPQAGRAFLEKALAAPPRPGRELADQGRREEIRALLSRIGGEGN
ncbi:TRAP transporter TatT component family protein [Pseudothauera rhizosphaerae]|uniref:Tetratricopeptide repeat protein n=1 Tax=Pseudothauera rhizosphaerae TaxID=2565932 RepID=A0A4S4AN34_9RHOO|nr:TRAP transporter TatT component family protein [Pseudothauera rhizosphaerae]THF61031.1 hypothetical protein E6O51_12470 [Pseudothauera rhizosphaerae]